VRPLRLAFDLTAGAAAVVAAPAVAVGRGAKAVAVRRLEDALDLVVPVAVDQVLRRVDVTALLDSYVDIDHVVDRIDLIALANEVIAGIDLPEIIRQSTGSVGSEAQRGMRMQAISGDEAVARIGERFRMRRTRAPLAPVVPGAT